MGVGSSSYPIHPSSCHIRAQGTVSEAYTDGRWWPVTTLTAEVEAEKENSSVWIWKRSLEEPSIDSLCARHCANICRTGERGGVVELDIRSQ